MSAIIADGIATGDFAAAVPAATARTVFEATASFHHPAHAAEWLLPDREQILADLSALIVKGLRG